MERLGRGRDPGQYEQAKRERALDDGRVRVGRDNEPRARAGGTVDRIGRKRRAGADKRPVAKSAGERLNAHARVRRIERRLDRSESCGHDDRSDLFGFRGPDSP